MVEIAWEVFIVKNMKRRIVLLSSVVVAGVFLLLAGTVGTLYFAQKILRPTIDMAGGTSLIYEIDTQELTPEEKKGLSKKMISVLQRRIDPKGILPLVWHPLGDTRFEIQMLPGNRYNPQDLQRMLKGTGILEFRILPTQGHPEVNADEMTAYVKDLKEKGPKYTSDNKYVWCEIENINEWKRSDVFLASFGNKSYVLASNKDNETLLHSTDGQKRWELEGARPSQDEMGRRAIGFTLDEKGGRLFANVTGKNLERPLCILLDGIAISAPNIQSRISREGIIVGNFTQTQQNEIVNKLNAGFLPARLVEQPISVKTIGPSIGTDNLDKGTPTGKKLLKDNN